MKKLILFCLVLLCSHSYAQKVYESAYGYLIVKGLDSEQKISYFGKIDSVTYFLISEDSKTRDYSQSRIFFGKYELNEEELITVVRYKDGGTTVFCIKNGTFYFPVDLMSRRQPLATFNGKTIECYDVNSKRISRLK